MIILTCLSENIVSTSTIDHFVGNQIVASSITEAGVTHYSENMSNHSPIFVKLDVGLLSVSTEVPIRQERAYWKKASEEERNHFKDGLANKLNSLTVPACVTCQNIHCKVHSIDIENYTMNIIEAIEASLPTVGGAKQVGEPQSRQVAGWTVHVKPFHDESKFWHGLWASAGKPLDGQLFHVMREARMHFKYSFRRLKRATNKLQNDKFV